MAGTRSPGTRSGRWPTRWTSCARSPPTCAELRRVGGAAGPAAGGPAVGAAAARAGQGRLDFRKTVRASLATGGVPVVTHHRPRTVHKPELVVLCDVSGSVAGFSHFTLMLTQALREHFSGVRAFAFVDSTDEVTRFFRPGADVADAVQRIGREADVVSFDGHSDYGNAFEVFAEKWAVGGRAEDLAAGARRRPDELPAARAPGAGRPGARAPARRTGSTRSRARLWGSGDSAADRYGEVIDMVECRNAAQLADFVTTL